MKQTMQTDVVILGGGIAGLQASLELSRMGRTSVVVEKAAFPGGHVAGFSCKATDSCQRCGACILEDVLHQVKRSKDTTVLVRSQALRIDRSDGAFQVRLSRRPPRIFPEACTDCGMCGQVCPVPGALVRSPRDNRLYVEEDRCLFFRDGSCKACSEACPEMATNLEGQPEELEVTSSVIIVATGFQPFDATEKPRFGHGFVPGVVTSLELDTLLRSDSWTLEPINGEPPSVAFIQCVGSRDAKIGRNYCSRVCCANALRTARVLKNRFPEIRISIFYMDLQNVDRDFDRRLKEAEQEATLVRAIPSEIRKSASGKPEMIYHGSDDARVIETVDLVVLSIGMSPPDLDGLLDLTTHSDGFPGLGADKIGTNIQGVFMAGAAQGPKSIEETMSHASRAAGEAVSYLQRRTGGGLQ